jgi:hypothetical protein
MGYPGIPAGTATTITATPIHSLHPNLSFEIDPFPMLNQTRRATAEYSIKSERPLPRFSCDT